MSRSYIKLVGNLTTVMTGTTTGGSTTNINNLQQAQLIRYISIGAWDMAHPNRGHTTSIPSDIPTAKIRSFDALIRSNGGDLFPFSYPDWTPSGRMRLCCTARTIELERDDGAFFTQSGFYGSSVNRGCVSITYSNIKSPSGLTGTVSGLAASCLHVDNNVVTFDGNYNICEYGVAYSQVTSNPTISACKVCTAGNIGVGIPYSKPITGLQDNTLTYFRMYAKNCEETGYGVVKCCTTPALPPLTSVDITLNRCNDFGIETNGVISFDQPLATGQWVCLSINYNQTINNIGSCGRVCIFCKPNGNPYYTDITSSIDPSNYMCTDNTRYCGFGGGQVYIGAGDSICYQNYSDGNSGSCSSFCIHPYLSSVGLTVTMSGNQEDCICNT